MSDTRILVSEIQKLQKIHTDLAVISERTDEQRKLELVQLRRQLAIQIGVISAQADKSFLTDADHTVALEFRSLLSAMRRGIALHQANWPAVKVDEQNPDYRQSIQQAREANSRFRDWAKINIGG